MVEAGQELVAGGVLEDEVTADAITEGEQIRGTEALDEASVTGEDDAEKLPGIEILAGQEAELGEDGGERLLSFIDDEDRAGERGGDVLGPASAEGLEAAPPVMGLERDTEEITELAASGLQRRYGRRTTRISAPLSSDRPFRRADRRACRANRPECIRRTDRPSGSP